MQDSVERMEAAKRVLKNIFQFDAFRLQQERVIRRLIVENKNALVLFPTGGQFVCFVSPAHLTEL
jgi:superfamily II DNA helicase RecQ